MINVARIIQKIKEKALREGDIQDAVSETVFQKVFKILQRKIPEYYPVAAPDEIQLSLVNSLCKYFRIKRQAEMVFPEEFILHAIQEKPQETIAIQAVPSSIETQIIAPQPETPLVNQSALAPQQHQTVASFNGLTALQWVAICNNSPDVSKMMYEDFRAATGQDTSSAESSTHHKCSENPQENQQHPMPN
ncbi:hypothetical protein BPAE_0210g00040 [Botrytis paeoniae]|uniref:Uncharacterized protein n=1 Tax=Botrytis paeoniae TaxID=278948 RepID=A0A4Z1FE67_9HELO|nr:hypothetical protein BPAE_0210g00040 [Botrytis paeoniae]